MSEEWCFAGDHPGENWLDVRMALNNLEDFIRDVQSHPCELYPQDDVGCPQEPLGRGPVVQERAFNLPNGGNNEYLYVGLDNVLNREGRLARIYDRVIFTPSKG